MARGNNAVDHDRFAALLPQLGKRPRAVLDHILRNGSVSTYELGQLGYDQPPRAAQDLKEAGVKLHTAFGKHPQTNARMAIYSLAGIDADATGRRAFPKRLRDEVIERHRSECNVCKTEYPRTVLQIDHRVPFIIGGEPKHLEADAFQPLCGSHQRSKSWACEHCPNRTARDLRVCQTCYWCAPDGAYTHVATVQERRVDITFVGEEIARYELAAKRAGASESDLQSYLKELIARGLRNG